MALIHCQQFTDFTFPKIGLLPPPAPTNSRSFCLTAFTSCSPLPCLQGRHLGSSLCLWGNATTSFISGYRRPVRLDSRFLRQIKYAIHVHTNKSTGRAGWNRAGSGQPLPSDSRARPAAPTALPVTPHPVLPQPHPSPRPASPAAAATALIPADRSAAHTVCGPPRRRALPSGPRAARRGARRRDDPRAAAGAERLPGRGLYLEQARWAAGTARPLPLFSHFVSLLLHRSLVPQVSQELPFLHPSETNVLNRLCRLGTDYIRFSEFVEQYTGHVQQQVRLQRRSVDDDLLCRFCHRAVGAALRQRRQTDRPEQGSVWFCVV